MLQQYSGLVLPIAVLVGVLALSWWLDKKHTEAMQAYAQSRGLTFEGDTNVWLHELRDFKLFAKGYGQRVKNAMRGAKDIGGVRVCDFQFTTGSGKRLAMLVDIEFAELGGNRRYTPIIRTHKDPWLEGRVRVCDGPGRARHLEASGEPNDNRATRFQLATSPMDTVQVDGLAPSHLYGQWDGSDSLAFEASLYLRRGKSAITQSDDPDTGLKRTPFTLRRGTEAEFTSLCDRL